VSTVCIAYLSISGLNGSDNDLLVCDSLELFLLWRRDDLLWRKHLLLLHVLLHIGIWYVRVQSTFTFVIINDSSTAIKTPTQKKKRKSMKMVNDGVACKMQNQNAMQK